MEYQALEYPSILLFSFPHSKLQIITISYTLSPNVGRQDRGIAIEHRGC